MPLDVIPLFNSVGPDKQPPSQHRLWFSVILYSWMSPRSVDTPTRGRNMKPDFSCRMLNDGFFSSPKRRSSLGRFPRARSAHLKNRQTPCLDSWSSPSSSSSRKALASFTLLFPVHSKKNPLVRSRTSTIELRSRLADEREGAHETAPMDKTTTDYLKFEGGSFRSGGRSHG